MAISANLSLWHFCIIFVKPPLAVASEHIVPVSPLARLRPAPPEAATRQNFHMFLVSLGVQNVSPLLKVPSVAAQTPPTNPAFRCFLSNYIWPTLMHTVPRRVRGQLIFRGSAAAIWAVICHIASICGRNRQREVWMLCSLPRRVYVPPVTALKSVFICVCMCVENRNGRL